MGTTKQLTDDVFYEKYTVQLNHLDDNAAYDGYMYETYGEERKYILEMYNKFPKNVWTIIDNNEGYTGICAGFHFVNRMGYFITEEEWQDENEEYTIWDETDINELWHIFTTEDINRIFNQNLDVSIDRETHEDNNPVLFNKLVDQYHDIPFDEKEILVNEWHVNMNKNFGRMSFSVLNKVFKVNLFSVPEDNIEEVLDKLRIEWEDMDIEWKHRYYEQFKEQLV